MKTAVALFGLFLVLVEARRGRPLDIENLGNEVIPGRTETRGLEPVVQELRSAEEVKRSTDELLEIISNINRALTAEESNSILIDAQDQHEDPPGFNCSLEVFHTKAVTYTDQVTCYEKAAEFCFKTHKIDFVPQPMTQCHDNYVKECQIKYRDEPYVLKVRECIKRPYTNCHLTEAEQAELPPVCQTLNETICSTEYVEKNVTESKPTCTEVSMKMCQNDDDESTCIFVPQKNCSVEEVVTLKVFPTTKCRDVEQEFCSPAACGNQEMKEVCNDIDKTLIRSVPVSECNLEKKEICNTVNKLMPKLVEDVNCQMQPRQSCSPDRILPQTVDQPVIKKLCRMIMN